MHLVGESMLKRREIRWMDGWGGGDVNIMQAVGSLNFKNEHLFVKVGTASGT